MRNFRYNNFCWVLSTPLGADNLCIVPSHISENEARFGKKSNTNAPWYLFSTAPLVVEVTFGAGKLIRVIRHNDLDLHWANCLRARNKTTRENDIAYIGSTVG